MAYQVKEKQVQNLDNVIVNQAEITPVNEGDILKAFNLKDMNTGKVYQFTSDHMDENLWAMLADTRLPNNNDINISQFVKFGTDRDASKLKWIAPIEGVFFAQIKDLRTWQDKEGDTLIGTPYPQLRSVPERKGISKKNNKPYSFPAHTEFTALFKVVSLQENNKSAFHGFQINTNVHYCFTEERDGLTGQPTGKAGIVGSGRDLDLFLLVLRLCGLDVDSAEPADYSDNVLADIYPYMKFSDAVVQITIKDGWVKKVEPANV